MDLKRVLDFKSLEELLTATSDYDQQKKVLLLKKRIQ